MVARICEKCVLSLEQKRKGVMNGESVEEDGVTSG